MTAKDDKTETKPEGGSGEDQGKGTGAEGDEKVEAFWTRLGDLVDSKVNGVLDKRIAEIQSRSADRQARNGGRRGLPDVLADLVFGPSKK